MEERIIDKDERRKVRLKRTENGPDAVDDLAPDDGREDADGTEDFVIDFEEERDEDLVGLTPTQFKEELERRERAAREAREESEKLTALAEERLAAGNAADAAIAFAQALIYDGGNERAEKGLWYARTDGFTRDDVFYNPAYAEEFAYAGEACRAEVLEKVGGRLAAERAQYAAEAAPLREKVEAAQAERRQPFRENRRYYALRFFVCLAAFIVFAVGIAVSASFLLRTRSIAPVVLMAVCGGLAFVAFVVLVVFARKLYVAARLCRDNEKLSSTEDGARLAWLDERLECLSLVLDGAPAYEEDAGAAEEGEEE